MVGSYDISQLSLLCSNLICTIISDKRRKCGEHSKPRHPTIPWYENAIDTGNKYSMLQITLSPFARAVRSFVWDVVIRYISKKMPLFCWFSRPCACKQWNQGLSWRHWWRRWSSCLIVVSPLVLTLSYFWIQSEEGKAMSIIFRRSMSTFQHLTGVE